MQVLCPKCGQVLGGGAVNVATDVAQCQRCSEVFPLSALVRATASGPVDRDNPPRGAWYNSDFDGFVVGATTRSLVALLFVPFMCVWSGGSLGGIYGMQVAQGRFNPMLSLFGIPFLLGTLALGSAALMTLCGRVSVRVNDDEGVVFTGIGSIGWRRRFNPREVSTVRIEPYRTNNGATSMAIVLDGPHKLRFGTMLSEARRDFIANVLRLELASRKS